MAPFTCPYIKRDGTICGNKCWLPEGCYRHWKLYEKNSKKRPCLFSGCEFPTDADSGYCHDHSASIHSHNYRMKQKRKAEAKALRLAKTSELSVEGEQKILFYPLVKHQSRISYTAPPAIFDSM
jgi:hypothetical protein